MARLPQGVRARANGGYEKRFTVDGVRYSVYGATPKECMKKETEKRQAIAAVLRAQQPEALLRILIVVS